ncbi:protease inhibitor I42 family protein [Rhabdothermincola salaria]|uniref:protease inhibitor I42 family protein n=1 Tax=Rhabdothermincola salaria TaxID=2903142 RepID=UPI001E529C87|nr:protease inhibitor I42 family protein [Rhabdothermincola salaria]MCD9623543.1 protease inhibitor I42 family protein [Rhabdothermincola salaria]
MSRPCPAPSRHRRSPWPTAVVLAATLALGAGACTHEDASGPPTTNADEVATAVDDPLGYAAYADPAAPVEAQIGERFALILDAEPTEGYRWEVVSEVDRAVVLPLGSQFVLRDTVTNLPTTTVAPPAPPPPPPEEGTTDPAEQEADGAPEGVVPEDPETTAPPTTEAAPTTTTVPTRSLQVLSYVARAPGTTTVELRYVRVGQPDAEAPTVVFTIQVPVPPPLFPVPDAEAGEEEEQPVEAG